MLEEHAEQVTVLEGYVLKKLGRALDARPPRAVGVSLLLVAVALFLHALILPLHGWRPADARAEALADLSRQAGVEAALCARPGDSGPAHNNSDCSDDSQFCRFPGQMELILPEAPSLIAATLSASASLAPEAATSDPPPQLRVSPGQPRAPPFAV